MADYTDIEFFAPGTYFAIASGLSAVTSTIAFIACRLTRLHKEVLGYMIFAINFSDAVFFTVKLFASIYQPGHDFSCKLVQATGYFGLISSIFLSALFGHALYIVSVAQESRTIATYAKIYKLFAFGIPLTLAISQIPTNFVIFSPEAKACVHRFNKGAIDIPYIIFIYAPIGGSLVLSIVWFLMAAVKFKRMINTDSYSEIFILLIYPAIMLLCWGPIFIKNFLVMLDIQMGEELAFAIQIISLLQGFFDALVYGVSKKRFKKLCRYISCRKKARQTDPNLSGSDTPRREESSQLLERNYIRMSDDQSRKGSHLTKTAIRTTTFGTGTF